MTKKWSRRRSILVVIAATIFMRLLLMIFFAEYREPKTNEYGIIARHINAGYGYRVHFDQLYLEVKPPKELKPGEPGYLEWLAENGASPTPTAIMPPAYPLLLSWLFDWFGEPGAYLVVYLLQLLAATATALFVYLTVERLFGRRAGLWSGLLFAGTPGLAGAVILFFPAVFELLGLTAAVYLTVRAIKEPGRWVNWLLLGAVVGVTALFRELILFYLPLIPVVYLVARRDQAAGRRWKTALGRSAVTLAVALALFSPWIVFNAVRFEGFFPITNKSGLNMVRGFNDQTDGFETPHRISSLLWTLDLPEPPARDNEILVSQRLSDEAWGYITRNPGRSLGLVLKRAVFGLLMDPPGDRPGVDLPRAARLLIYLYQFLLLGLAVVGVIVERRRWRELTPFFALIMLFLAFMLPTFVSARNRLPVLLNYCLLGGPGLVWGLKRFFEGRQRKVDERKRAG